MKIQEIRKIAKYWGIDTRVGRSKQDLIREIQVREGNEPCFQTRQECENDCLWKEDCLKRRKNSVRFRPFIREGTTNRTKPVHRDADAGLQ